MRRPSLRTLTSILAAGAVWLVGVFCFVEARPLLDYTDDFSPRDFTEFHGSVVGSLLGQFRMSVGDLLWLKSDEYLHSGVRHRKRTQRERDEDASDADNHHHGDDAEPSGPTGTVGNGSEHEDHDHDRDMVTVIPAADADVRGIFGDLDREVHPFALHAAHSDPNELAPWYRLLTYVNPNHVRGYIVGAYVIGEHGNQPEAAVEFLLEGERNNPLSLEIKEALGRFYLFQFADPDRALAYFEQAIAIGQGKAALESGEEFALRNAYRNRVLAYWQGKNDPATARRYLIEALERFPRDKALQRVARQLTGFGRAASSGGDRRSREPRRVGTRGAGY